VDAATPRTVFQWLGDESDDRWIFTPNRVWIERRDGTIVEERSDPRAAFAGHVRETPWDRLHLTYFLGYAVWNYLTTPFLFARMGFSTQELEAHVEGRDTWRVLEVTYPDDVPAHTKVQQLYFDDEFMLRRLDYVTDVLGGVAAHYCYDHVTIDGTHLSHFAARCEAHARRPAPVRAYVFHSGLHRPGDPRMIHEPAPITSGR
jgi:hypothetical protein